ncbi:acyltransferase family protein [Serratia fonticola]
MHNLPVSKIICRDGNNLDLIRLIASLSVIIYHSFALNPQWGLTDPIKNNLTYITTGGLAVKIFFFISGLLVANSIITRRSSLHFILSRFFRIFPGLMLVILGSSFIIGPVFTNLTLLEYITSNELYTYIFKNISLNTQYFLPGVFPDSKYGINGSLWTIRYEVFAYLILLIFFLLGLIKGRLIPSIICILIIVEPVTPFKGLLFASSENSAIYLLAPCFALGVILAVNKSIYISNLFVPAILILLQFLFKGEEAKSLLICLSACLLALHISSLEVIKKLKLRNDISYGVYLWGFPIQQVYSQTFNLGFISNITLSIITTIFIALISWKLVEKPFIILSKSIFNNYSMHLNAKNTHK